MNANFTANDCSHVIVAHTTNKSWNLEDTHQCDSQTPNIGADIVALPGRAGVYSLGLKIKQETDLNVFFLN